MAFAPADFAALTSMLTPGEEDNSVDAKTGDQVTPASIGAPGPSPAELNRLSKATLPSAKVYRDTSKDIWTEDEIPDAVDDEVEDDRIRPEHEFMYRQAVGTEDSYMGMGDKDPGSNSCEDLLLRVKLPGGSMKDLDLEVQSTYLKLQTAQYKLNLYLPNKVDEKRGNAKWDSKTEELNIYMPIIREDPF